MVRTMHVLVKVDSGSLWPITRCLCKAPLLTGILVYVRHTLLWIQRSTQQSNASTEEKLSEGDVDAPQR